MNNKTKIVCTIGPACSSLETVKDMMRAGMDVARFNMSHGSHESHLKLINLVKQARFELGLPVAIMLDTKGPEIRIGKFADGEIELKTGSTFVLTTENVIGDESIVSVTYDGLPGIVKKGTSLLVNDGLIELEVIKVTKNLVYTTVIVGGKLSNNKSINIPSVDLNMEYLSEIDKSDLIFGAENGVDIYSISFVNRAQDVVDVREFLAKNGATNSFIVAKIESQKGVDNIDQILDVADGIMVARGDMGVEIEFEKLPSIQKSIIAKANQKGKYTITATQMLESMVENARPTRAEISDIANAIYDGTAAIMLSGETSAGKYPVLSVKTMQRIASETERTMLYQLEDIKDLDISSITTGVGYAACSLAKTLNAKAILVSTASGRSALEISRFRPRADIIAITPSYEIFIRLGMFWGVTPLLDKIHYDTDSLLKSARERSLEAKCIEMGDLVVQTAGIMTGASGSDLLLVSKIGN